MHIKTINIGLLGSHWKCNSPPLLRPPLQNSPPLLRPPLRQWESSLIREGENLVVFYYLSASEIWHDKKGGLRWEGFYYCIQGSSDPEMTAFILECDNPTYIFSVCFCQIKSTGFCNICINLFKMLGG
jgi:hypothetical protein